jgi:hypothetical protein
MMRRIAASFAMRHRSATLAVLTVACLASAPVHADSRDPAAADALFRQGREAMKRGDLTTACPKFAESQRLDPAGGTLLNLAECEEKSGLLASAQQHYREASEVLSSDDPRAAHSRKQAAALDKRVPRLTITAAGDMPSGTRIRRDEVEMGPASLGAPLPVDPGRHVIVVSAPGRRDNKIAINLAQGDTRTIEVEPGAVDESSSTTSDSAEGSTSHPHHETTGLGLRTTGMIVGAVGVVGLGIGTAYALRARSKDLDSQAYCGGGAQLPDDQCLPNTPGKDLSDQSRSAATVATWSFIGGGVALATGIVMIFAAPSSSHATSSRGLSWRAVTGPNVAALELTGAW